VSTRKNGGNTYTDQTGKFARGNPGRPKGSRNRHVLAVENLLEGETERLTRKVVDLALDGDTTAMRLCMERILPPRKDRPVNFDLPTVSNAGEAAKDAQAVMQATSDGELTPIEAGTVLTLIKGYTRVLELAELEGRVKALERTSKVGAQ